MILGMEIGLLIMGLCSLATGKMTLWKGRVVHGPAARFLGLIAMAPLPAIFAAGRVNVMGSNAAMLRPDAQLQIAGMEFGMVVLAMAVIYGLGILWSAPLQRAPILTEQEAFRLAFPERFGGALPTTEVVQEMPTLSTMRQQPDKARSTSLALVLLVSCIIAYGMAVGGRVSRPDLRTSATRPPADPAVKPVQCDAADPPANLPERVDPRLLVPGARWYLTSLQEFAWKPGAPGWTLGKGGLLGDPAARRMIHFHAQPTTSSLSMHPPDHGYTRVCYYLRQHARVLRGQTCLSDDDPNEKPHLTCFLVLGDGKLLWQAEHQSTTTAALFDLDISEVNILELRTHVKSGNSAGSHAVWLDTYVLTKGGPANSQANSQKRPPGPR